MNKKSPYIGAYLAAFCLFSAVANGALPVVDGEGHQLPSLSPLVKRINSAVVNIATESAQRGTNPLLEDPIFRRFFNAPQPMPDHMHRTQSAGSGVVIDAKKGLIVTNNHVVTGASKITVGFSDGRMLVGKLLGADPEVDIAVVQVEATNLTEIQIGNSDNVEAGDFVVAVGNPFGLTQTVTTGVVSAVGRSGLGIEGYENFIQTDASINPGNSGGALVGLDGKLMGINTAILAPTGGNVGIGFAIPSNMAMDVVNQIITHGEVKRGRLGISIQDLTPDLAAAFGLDKIGKGVVVATIESNSPAAKADIKPGDVITAVNGKSVAHAAELRNAIGLKRPGDNVTLTVVRESKEKTVSVQLASANQQLTSAVDVQPGQQGEALLDGLQLRQNDEGGLVVEAIQPGSRAAAGGLAPGDIIVEAEHQNVRSLSQLEQIASTHQKRMLLRIERGNGALYLVLKA